MKKMIAILSLVSLSLTAFAADIQPIKETAANAAVAITKANLSSMGTRLDVQVFGVVEIGRSVKVELGIGSVDRPARMQNCITVSFDDNGYIKSLSNVIDSNSCD